MAAQDKYLFAEASQKLWLPEFGDPGTVEISAGGHKPARKFKGKMRGQFTFPFSLTLPSVIPLKQGPYTQYSLPSTFNGVRVSISYTIVARVTRGLFTSEHE